MGVTELIFAKVSRLFQLSSHRCGFLSDLFKSICLTYGFLSVSYERGVGRV
jgi:hypothetical protein